ncbi:MAG TPA: SAM-dependent methyltransferase [Aquabacterium sp.]|uniref:SAM-dependent methyltransferase n=1 Tax=Aquabacterium sp. TaxID=1872578 RepID=UPI002E2F5FA1|nr:SAM-dependent methyltransferase [Aquabacterium sp.]HEX5356781.1 SAM-dependent methyltransferase [Aquabacterium sp.]
MPQAPQDKPGRYGRLLLIPNTLDLGCLDTAEGSAAPDLREVLPMGAIMAAAGLRHWIAENAKTTRAFLKRVGEITPLAAPMQEQQIQVLPRPPKGGHKRTGGAPSSEEARQIAELLAPALAGHDVGLISEAGLPGVADPGAAVVLAAHKAGVSVLPLSGPSSLVLALAASGLHGQSFAFVGYLPVEAQERSQRIKELEQLSRKAHQTQLVIETPYRNPALWQALVQHLQGNTLLSVSVGLTLPQGWSRTDTVEQWRKQALTLPDDIPAVFSWLAA